MEMNMGVKKRITDFFYKIQKSRAGFYAAVCLAVVTVLASILYFVFWPDNLMHSDMAAEVMLSKLLSEEGGLLSKNWFYSTEIRIVYTQLIMTPLFCFISDFGVVKLISVIFYDVLLVVVFYFTGKRFGIKKSNLFLMMALLAAPLSNEYLDMMLLGNFYTSQTICTYCVLMFFYREDKKDKKSTWIRLVLLCVAALILGLSGLRYLASLYVPMVLSVMIFFFLDRVEREEKADNRLIFKLGTSILLCFFAGIGFLINKFYLAANYSFDQTPISFVPIGDVVDRFLVSVKLMIEFVGYREIGAVSGLGIVNVVKFAFLVFLIYVIAFLTKHRKELLTVPQRMLLYYFHALFFINWYMLVFTDVLQQYRYWLPVYITAILLVGIYLQNYKPDNFLVKPVCIAIVVVTVLASLYGELWQDTKYNDCEKRYGYMDFLEKNGYDFGYATFWNADVTEYLSNGEIHVGNLGGDENGSAPYEWLSRKEYYKKGYHTGKTFLLLARTEEPALFQGDITIMTDSVKVYEDEYYVIYEGEGMYLFSE